MLKKGLLLTTLLTSLAPAASYATFDNLYGALEVGGSFPNKSTNAGAQNAYPEKKAFDNSFLVGAGVGMQFDDHFRSDIMATYRPKMDYKGQDKSENPFSDYKQDISSWSFMLNGYYDVMNYHGFTPFVSAGLGFAHNRGKTLTINDNENNPTSITKGESVNKTHFAWQLGGGVNYPLASNVSVGLSYRYVDLGKIYANEVISSQTTNRIKSNLKTHEGLLTLRYHF